MRAYSLDPVDPVARRGRGRPTVQEHFHAFHAFIHPAWPDGSRHLNTGSEVAGKPGSEDRYRERLGLSPPGCPP